MKPSRPLIRLLNLTAITIVVVLTALQWLRWIGAQEKFVPSHHPWMNDLPWLVARLTPENCSQSGLKSLLEIEGPWRIWLDVQSDSNKNWLVVCPLRPFFLDNVPFGPKLVTILPMLKDRGVIFNVRTVDSEAAAPFLKTIDEWAGKRIDIGLASPTLSVLRELRKRRPEWVFAADFATWTKLKFYASLGLESTADLWPDFFVAGMDPDLPNYFSIATADEIIRRKKVILLHHDDETEIPSNWKPRLDGIMTNRPKKSTLDAIFEKMGAK